MNSGDLIKKADINKIAEAGTEIYDTVKSQYEPAQIGFPAAETLATLSSNCL